MKHPKENNRYDKWHPTNTSVNLSKDILTGKQDGEGVDYNVLLDAWFSCDQPQCGARGWNEPDKNQNQRSQLKFRNSAHFEHPIKVVCKWVRMKIKIHKETYSRLPFIGDCPEKIRQVKSDRSDPKGKKKK